MRDLELVEALKALGDARRFRMVQEVAAAGELSCGQIAELFTLSQPTISHHLKILTDSGILVVRAEAKHHFFSVNRALVRRVLELLPGRLGSEERSARTAARD